jgi:hypothetical protein
MHIRRGTDDSILALAGFGAYFSGKAMRISPQRELAADPLDVRSDSCQAAIGIWVSGWNRKFDC